MRISDWSSDVCSSDLQAWELSVGALFDVGLTDPGEGDHPGVLAHGEVREHAAPLGDGADPSAGECVRRGAVHVSATDVDAPRRGRQLAAGHLEGGGLAAAVRSEEHTSEPQQLIPDPYAQH